MKPDSEGVSEPGADNITLPSSPSATNMSISCLITSEICCVQGQGGGSSCGNDRHIGSLALSPGPMVEKDCDGALMDVECY